MESIRLFIAIEMSADVRRALAQVQSRVRGEVAQSPVSLSLSRSIKWVDPEGAHLTLKFLGWVSPTNVPAIEDRLRTIGASNLPLNLHLDGLGTFPSPQRARVLWIGLAGDLDGLEALQRGVESAMQSLGFAAEERPFSPHITLARLRDDASPSERRQLADIVSRLPTPPQVSFRAQAISLMRSELSPSGARYTRLALLPLAGTPTY